MLTESMLSLDKILNNQNVDYYPLTESLSQRGMIKMLNIWANSKIPYQSKATSLTYAGLVYI
jgi:hypothetical protein